jgi:hypothetical protein
VATIEGQFDILKNRPAKRSATAGLPSRCGASCLRRRCGALLDSSVVLPSPDQQISLADPDSRSMATSGRGSGVVLWSENCEERNYSLTFPLNLVIVLRPYRSETQV